MKVPCHLFQSAWIALAFLSYHLSTSICASLTFHSTTSHLFPFVTNSLTFFVFLFCSTDTCFLCMWKRICIVDICGCAQNRLKSSAPSWHRPSSVTITRTQPSTGTLNSVPQSPTKPPSTGKQTKCHSLLSLWPSTCLCVVFFYIKHFIKCSALIEVVLTNYRK